MKNVKDNTIAIRLLAPIPAYILSDKETSLGNISSGYPVEEGVTHPATLIKKLERRITALKNKEGDNDLDVAIAIDAVARAYFDDKQFEKAFQNFNDALASKKKALPQHHPSIADTLRSKGDVSRKIGLHEESEFLYRAAHAIYREAFDNRSWITPGNQESKHKVDHDLHQMLSMTLINIGTIHFDKKEYKQALQAYNEAKQEAKMSAIDAVVLDRHNSADSSRDTSRVAETRVFISVIMNNIATVYAEQKSNLNAVKTYNEALNLQMQEVGEDHLSVSCTLHNMGTFHYKNGEYQLALKCYKQVLKMRRLLLGNEHISIADALMNIAIVHEKASELDRAESALNAALRVVSKVFDENDFRAAFIVDCIGALNARNGYDLDALTCFTSALKNYKEAQFDDDHPLVINTKKSIEYVRNKHRESNNASEHDQSLVEVHSVYDLMSSFLTCGGLCFNAADVDIKSTHMPVLV